MRKTTSSVSCSAAQGSLLFMSSHHYWPTYVKVTEFERKTCQTENECFLTTKKHNDPINCGPLKALASQVQERCSPGHNTEFDNRCLYTELQIISISDLFTDSPIGKLGLFPQRRHVWKQLQIGHTEAVLLTALVDIRCLVGSDWEIKDFQLDKIGMKLLKNKLSWGHAIRFIDCVCMATTGSSTASEFCDFVTAYPKKKKSFIVIL